MDEVHFKECLMELLQDMFGEDSVPKIMSGETIKVTVDNKDAIIWLNNMTVENWLIELLTNMINVQVSCEEDKTFQQIVQTAVSKLHQSLVPSYV